jgi:hypothetical protein
VGDTITILNKTQGMDRGWWKGKHNGKVRCELLLFHFV